MSLRKSSRSPWEQYPLALECPNYKGRNGETKCTKTEFAWLKQVPLEEEEAQARESDLRLLEQTEREIVAIDERRVRIAWEDEKVRLLMSIPGIDYTVAQTCLAAIGDVSRFANGKKLAAYLRLNPSTRQSGPHCYHGPITKQGNAHARWLLVQAAQHLGQYRGPKAGGAGVAAAEHRRTVPLRGAEEFTGQILATARARHGPSPPRRGSPGNSAVCSVWTDAGCAFA